MFLIKIIIKKKKRGTTSSKQLTIPVRAYEKLILTTNIIIETAPKIKKKNSHHNYNCNGSKNGCARSHEQVNEDAETLLTSILHRDDHRRTNNNQRKPWTDHLYIVPQNTYVGNVFIRDRNKKSIENFKKILHIIIYIVFLIIIIIIIFSESQKVDRIIYQLFFKSYDLGGVGFEPTTLSLRGICSTN